MPPANNIMAIGHARNGFRRSVEAPAYRTLDDSEEHSTKPKTLAEVAEVDARSYGTFCPGLRLWRRF